MDCEVVRKSAITENIWNTESKPSWFHALFPILIKGKRKKKSRCLDQSWCLFELIPNRVQSISEKWEKGRMAILKTKLQEKVIQK